MAQDRFAAKRALFRELLREHGGALYSFAMSLTGNPADAEDLAAEGFARALKSFDRYDPSRSFASWVFKIMHNAFRDRMRRSERKRTVSLEGLGESEDEGESATDQFAAPEPSLDAGLESSEAAVQVRAALAKVPFEFREPMVLRDTASSSYGEIAAALGVPVATVRTRIFRGRRLLRKLLDPYLSRGDII